MCACMLYLLSCHVLGSETRLDYICMFYYSNIAWQLLTSYGYTLEINMFLYIICYSVSLNSV